MFGWLFECNKVVVDTTKVDIFKQITTKGQIEAIVQGCC